MKLSIWQQFSSNHSGGFTVVGKFESVGAANAAKETLEHVICAIAGWFMKPENQGDPIGDTPTLIEQRFADEYNLKWEKRVDWLTPYRPEGHGWSHYTAPEQHIWQYDHLVVVDLPYDERTFQTGQQFAAFIQALGGESFQEAIATWVPDSEYKRLSFSISCLAPTSEKAETLYEIIKDHLASEKSEVPRRLTPWYRYHLLLAHYGNNIPGQFSPMRETSITARSCLIDESLIKLEQCYGNIFSLPALVDWMRDEGCAVEYQLIQE